MIHSFPGRKKFYIPAIIILALSLPLFFANAVMADLTRSISVVAKSAKGGKAQNIMLYDYTAALIIGIDRYADLGSRDQLSFALKDARGMEKVLRENYRFNEIVTLYNEDATRDKIMAALYRFRELSPDAGLLVYFAGHGITMPAMVGKNDLGFLIPADGSLNASEMYKNISMQQIKSDICPQINAKHIFFVFDACFAGLMLDTRATLTKPGRDLAYLQAITKEQARQVLTAGSKGQRVLDGGPRGHSVFTGRLIEALENTEDYITARELGQELKKQVYGDAAARGHNQRPVDGEIYGTGDFVFVPDLEKRQRDLNAEVVALETEMARLNELKADAARAQDQAKQREIERQQLIKEAELKQAQIRREQKEEALKRQEAIARQAVQEARQFELAEKEKEQRLAMLRLQADKMRKELGGDMIGSATVEDAVSELKRIQSHKEKIEADLSRELKQQIESLSKFYDDKINRIMKIKPWDKEFETKEDYDARKRNAEGQASIIRREKEQKLAKIHQKLSSVIDGQVQPLEEQISALSAKVFPVPANQVSFRFTKYQPFYQKMHGELSIGNKRQHFNVVIPKEKAREYKSNPHQLVLEVQMKASLWGSEFKKILFHVPGSQENYTASPSNSIGMEFIHIKRGTFIMGRKPFYSGQFENMRPHHVTLTRGYYMQTTEVTQGQWKAVMGSNPSHNKACGNNCPVERISWSDAQKFIRELNRLEGTNKYRLPTEAEWEYACRAGNNSRFCFGNDDSDRQVGKYAWYTKNSSSSHPVAQKRANVWGLYDMHGNVYEWCQDWKDDYPVGSVIDPEGPSSGTRRVKRGGSWNDWAGGCESGDRDPGSPRRYTHLNGFRLAMTE